MTLKDKIINYLKDKDGLTDREIANAILGTNEPQQAVNQACRALVSKGIIKRVNRIDGLIGNYLVSDEGYVDLPSVNQAEHMTGASSVFKEDNLKQILKDYLHADGWETQIAWGKVPGIDINAVRGNERWIIEVKGLGSLNAMNVNFFLGVLAETLQRMDDPNAKYSIALPDVKQFRNLWNRLPLLAKKRTGITAIFINEVGDVFENEN
ncbi:winged helix-turn-helix domain-containing protein [Brevibacillus ruminantium]|uniref:Winged helix-turn-helix domain-containing protein n=1 Tax=Brevibacillus ruminantium TaxID=2950604 RepID=A0ABY4WH22_9BACL|nr:winged helix-turn-helix domain-containing protein [Brevibacillus ruminantium]USG66106.1 winged helix-turn-helix domain-containing protein [Brevibacillus ruminantium]